MEKNKAAEAAQISNQNLNDNSASSQRARVIHALRSGPKTTIELRRDWGIMQPAPRVFELKARGYIVVTTPVSAHTDDGALHRGVARYVLLREPQLQDSLAVTTHAPANDPNFGADL
jgi:hypothetical protein